MGFCIRQSEIDESIHVIVSGPYDSAGQCAEGCGQAGSGDITILETEAFTAQNSPGQAYFRVRMQSQNGSDIFWYAEGDWDHTIETSSNYRYPTSGFESAVSGAYLGASLRLENVVSGSTATFRLYVSQSADLGTFSLLTSLSATIP